VQPAFSAGYACKSDAKAVPKMVEEFLKPCGRPVQVNCCPPDWGVLPLESKDGLAHRCQLDAEECIF
jgi:hypothetical protein